ncbi:methylated-DNA--[protein]-cysteine S-methyltransferase [Thermasporomyces composti]|jgi:methylated-DNA-[protein]-cysteine S-methyltransferase|uniref:Methylated-DNA--protein-cysteine methyltransferase n=1 Tax=Thermasporomyces composti TaxID=696763 RepID=A0A3D9VCE5_THECX|nr:methylated-DNA--[protein]-cysteine S-methyltransferase [Thermasporomyces composti]REF35844.1 methylated-DNA-[protein]-cysteine S-methyltransferase [Thermasporomyces composti]
MTANTTRSTTDAVALGPAATGHVDTVTVDSPVGALELRARAGFLTHVLFVGSAPIETVDTDNPVLRAAVEQLNAYFAGESTAFDLPLRPEGTPFQQRVWAALADIPYGETRTYAEIARAIGAPTAYRAVGAANGQNPLPIVLPCHRVIGSNGSLTGYGGGMERKRILLELEARVRLQREFA